MLFRSDATLETADPVLLIAGVEAPRLIKPLEHPNAWRIQRTDQVTKDEKGKTSLRLKVRRTGGNEWNGDLVLTPAGD